MLVGNLGNNEIVQLLPLSQRTVGLKSYAFFLAVRRNGVLLISWVKLDLIDYRLEIHTFALQEGLDVPWCKIADPDALDFPFLYSIL